MATSKGFLVLDLDTGRMDGWYRFHQDAAWAAEQRRIKTDHRWVVMQLSDSLGHRTNLNQDLCQLADLVQDVR
jgi:hypothetical protein